MSNLAVTNTFGGGNDMWALRAYALLSPHCTCSPSIYLRSKKVVAMSQDMAPVKAMIQ